MATEEIDILGNHSRVLRLKARRNRKGVVDWCAEAGRGRKVRTLREIDSFGWMESERADLYIYRNNA